MYDWRQFFFYFPSIPSLNTLHMLNLIIQCKIFASVTIHYKSFHPRTEFCLTEVTEQNLTMPCIKDGEVKPISETRQCHIYISRTKSIMHFMNSSCNYFCDAAKQQLLYYNMAPDRKLHYTMTTYMTSIYLKCFLWGWYQVGSSQHFGEAYHFHLLPNNSSNRFVNISYHLQDNS